LTNGGSLRIFPEGSSGYPESASSLPPSRIRNNSWDLDETRLSPLPHLGAPTLVGYPLAFAIGGLSVAAGIVLAVALLRPTRPRPQLQLVHVPAPSDAALTEFETERQAA
jgi:hypothetical protein